MNRKFHSGKNFAQYTWLYIFLERRNYNCETFTNSWSVESGLVRWLGVWREQDWKIDEKNI